MPVRLPFYAQRRCGEPITDGSPSDFSTDYKKVTDKIEDGEKKIKELGATAERLNRKVKIYQFPMQELTLSYGQNKGKQYTEEEDRFLLVRLQHWGIERDDVYELIKRDSGEWPLFRYVPASLVAHVIEKLTL